MSFFSICQDDPLILELRDVFRMNVLRIPEERIRPLAVLSSTSRAVTFLGDISTLIEGSFDLPPNVLKESEIASLYNRRSGVIQSKMGLEVLSGLVSGLRRDGTTPDLSAAVSGEKALRFNFPKIVRRYIEVASLGSLLAKRRFDRDNLLFEALLDPKVGLRVVDSVLTSADLEIEGGDEGGFDASVNLNSLAQSVAGGHAAAAATSRRSVHISSSRPLSFAFTCLTIHIDRDGLIRSLSPFEGKVKAPQMTDQGRGTEERGTDAHVLLTSSAELIEVG